MHGAVVIRRYYRREDAGSIFGRRSFFRIFFSKTHYVKLSEVCTYSTPNTDVLTVLPLIRFLERSIAAAVVWQIIGTMY